MKRILLVISLLILPLYAHAAQPASSPAAPLLAAAAAPGTVTLTYTASVTPGTLTNVYRCTGVGCTNFTQIATGQPAGGPYTDSTVTAGVYSWYVTATENGAESTTHSNVATLTISPQPPTGLTATAN